MQGMELEETLRLHLTKSQHQRAGPDELVWSPSLVRDVLASLTSPALPCLCFQWSASKQIHWWETTLELEILAW